MKRVLIFSLTYHPFIGGAEVAIKEITDRLDPEEYAFEMVTLRFDSTLPRIEQKGNVRVHRIGMSVPNAQVSDRAMPMKLKLAKILFPFTAYAAARRLHREHRFDMVWAMLANQAAFAALFFKSRNKSIPYVLELQDGRAFEEMKTRRPVLRLIWGLYRRIYLAADRIKVISKFLEKEVRAIGYTGTVEVIPNAVDVAKFSAPVSHDTATALKKKFNKQEGDVFLFTASRLVLSRGVEDCIRALSYLPQHVKLLIAGSGEDEGMLKKIVSEHSLNDRVIFAGHISHDELPLYYKVSDIFVRPSVIEGFGNAFVEAFAAGIPVVATPVGGIPDFLFDGETGVFCKVQDPKSLASAIERYLNDPQLASKVTFNAKVLVAEKYDWNVVARAMRERIFKVG